MGVLIVAVVVVGGYFLLTSKKAVDTNTEVRGEETKKIAFSELVKQGGSYKCDVKQAMSDFENSGTVYMNGSNLRGDFSTIAEGRPIDTSFIFRDGYSYTWSSALSTMGFKMKVPANAEMNGAIDASGTYGWSANQIGDYNCEPWTVDQSKFALPAGMTFTEIGK